MRTLLPEGSIAGKTGVWVFVAMGGKRAFPARVSAWSSDGSWTAGDVIIEELLGGIPGQSNSPFGPSADTGTVETLGTIGTPTPSKAADLIIDKPVEFIRARTDSSDNGFTGKVHVGIEMLE